MGPFLGETERVRFGTILLRRIPRSIDTLLCVFAQLSLASTADITFRNIIVRHDCIHPEKFVNPRFEYPLTRSIRGHHAFFHHTPHGDRSFTECQQCVRSLAAVCSREECNMHIDIRYIKSSSLKTFVHSFPLIERFGFMFCLTFFFLITDDANVSSLSNLVVSTLSTGPFH